MWLYLGQLIRNLGVRYVLPERAWGMMVDGV
jgi:hypothetical protein